MYVAQTLEQVCLTAAAIVVVAHLVDLTCVIERHWLDARLFGKAVRGVLCVAAQRMEHKLASVWFRRRRIHVHSGLFDEPWVVTHRMQVAVRH